MPTENIEFKNASGETLSARLELPPDRRPANFAVFAHCFTCNKNFRAVRDIGSALAAKGFGVLTFDFTGLGDSEGEFEETTFSGSVDDLVAAANFLAKEYAAPSLMVGHSLGGTATLLAANRLEPVGAVVTIGSPSTPQHVKNLFSDRVDEIVDQGSFEVDIGGRPFVLKREFVEDLDRQDTLSVVRELGKALLILHSPEDQIVGIDDAAILYKAAKHPKSFVSLSGADHLLSSPEDGRYAGEIIASWAARYVDKHESIEPRTKEDVVARLPADEKFTTALFAGGHRMTADEPQSFGGNNFGPSPYGFVSSGLAACTAMTLRMYADRKGWELGDVNVHVSHGKTHAEDCADCETRGGKIDTFTRTIEFASKLDDTQKKKLLEIADKCPVHRTLEANSLIKTSLAD